MRFNPYSAVSVLLTIEGIVQYGKAETATELKLTPNGYEWTGALWNLIYIFDLGNPDIDWSSLFIVDPEIYSNEITGAR